MRTKWFFFSLLLIHAFVLFAGDLGRIQKKFENKDWEKTEELIIKAIEQEPINPGPKYYYSLLYLEPTFSRTNLDSARILAAEAIADLDKASEKIVEELAKENVLESDFTELHELISRRCFERAKKRSTLTDWNDFLSQFPEFEDRKAALDYRDALVFDQLTDSLTISAAKDFIENYPASIFMERVKNKLDSMLVKKHSSSQSQQDLVRFLQENPKSEYASEALDNLLPLMTLSGDRSDFLYFVRAYPKTKTAQKALAVLFHLDAERNFSDKDRYLDFHPKSDSLRAEITNKNSFFFPVFEKTFQLVSPAGRSVETGLTELDQDLICEGIQSDIVAGLAGDEPKILNLQGKLLFAGKLIKDLGYGFLLIEAGDQKSLVHKSGLSILENIEDAEVLNGSFLKVKKSKWGLYSLLGLQVADHRFDDIFLEGNFWFFEKDGLFAIMKQGDLTSTFPEGLFLEFKFDDFEVISEDKLIGFRDDRECMIRSDGSFLVPWGVHQIFPGDYKEYVKDSRGYAFFDHPERFEYVEANEGFTVRKISSDQWSLFANKQNWMLPLRDSLSLINNFCAMLTGPERILFFTNKNQLKLTDQQQVFALSPTHPYLLIKDDVSAVINESGERVFSGNFDQIKLLSDSLFSVSFRNKIGAITSSGKQILPIDYDFISLSDNIVTVLKKNKIGMLDLKTNTLIEPKYESTFFRFGAYYQTSVAGKFGLLDSDENEVLPFQYDHLTYWTDSLVWAKLEDKFQLVNLTNLEAEMEVTLLSDFPCSQGKMVKFYDTRGFGLRHSELGLILEPTFSDIRILGTPDRGVLIGEQALPQAGYRVLSYFDIRGSRIYSQAYRSEDYERLFCDD